MRKKFFILAIPFALAIAFSCAWHFHFFPFKNPYARIPVQFTSSQIPYTQVEIEGQKYLLEIDLGADCHICLHKTVLEKINKKFLGKTYWHDVRGREYESDRYLIQKIQMGKVEITTPTAVEEDMDFSQNACIWNRPEAPNFITSGRIGCRMAQTVPLLLDFNNSVFFLVRNRKNLKKLEREGYLLENLFEVPFNTIRGKIIFSVNTEMGTKRLWLDTGASVTIIKPTLATEEELKEMRSSQTLITTSKFVIGDHDFGKMDLSLYDLSDKLGDFDGVLGMDFCKKHVIYLDIKENKALIGPAEKIHPVLR